MKFLAKMKIFWHKVLLRLFRKYQICVPNCPYDADTPHYDINSRLFIFRGSYREIGRQYCRAISMEGELRRAREYIYSLDRHSRGKLRREIENAKEMIKKNFSQLFEMMRGACDVHVRYSIDEIMLLTFSSVLTDWQTFRACSAISVLRAGRPLLGQNLDLGCTNATALAYLIPEDGCAVLTHVNPETLWFTVGVNEFGFSVTGASVNVDRENIFSGALFPTEILLSCILWQARDVRSACGLLKKLLPVGPFNQGANLILADKSGDVKNVEIAGDALGFNSRDINPWIATNHFRTPGLCRINRHDDRMSIMLEENSIARYKFARSIFQKGLFDSLAVANLLRGENPPGAWCRRARGKDSGYTTASYIIDFANTKFHYWLGVSAQKEGNNFFDLDLLYQRMVSA
ncbi:hypothetical protein GF348_06765 [candidate division KSB3 bacterium]|nr:hypothetical protein [candidate division KSB3 bacterium]